MKQEVLQAQKLYKKGMKLVDIAKKLDVPAGTVRRWKCTYGWDERSGENSERSKYGKKKKDKEPKEVISTNPALNEKQQIFCTYYVKCFNATKAYMKAYGCDRYSAGKSGHNLLKKPEIREEIEKLKQTKLSRELLTADDIFQKYIDIAFADIMDCIDVVKGVAVLKPADQIDGTVISEIRFGKDTSVRLADRMRALQWLTDHVDLMTEEQKIKIEMLKKQSEKISQDDQAEEDGVNIYNDV